MEVFLTGGTGFVGQVVVRDLLAHGHTVDALARGERSATRLRELGATPVRGELADVDLLRRTADHCDAMVHTAFDNTSLWRFPLTSRTERAMLRAVGDAYRGTGRSLVAAGGLAPVRPRGEVLVESDPVRTSTGLSGRNVERTLDELAADGVAASVVRMPCVHGDGDHFTLARLVELARRHGRSAFVGDGSNRVAAVHVVDAGRLYRLAMERGGAAGYHAVAEQGVAFREVAEAIGRGLGVPTVELTGPAAVRHFGAMYGYAAGDRPADSRWTRQVLDWQPTGPGILADLDRPEYFVERS